MRLLTLAATVFLLGGCSHAQSPPGPAGQLPPEVRPAAGPTESRLVSNKLLSAVDLAGELGLAGFQLRSRAVTIEPGGHTAAHIHQGRPTLEFVAQGVVVEVRNGVPLEHRAGAMVQGVNGVHHWWENRGTVPVVLVPVDIVKP